MTSRERVMAALNHEATEQCAVDLGGHRSSGIMGIAYARLKDYLGIKSGNIYIYDMLQQLAVVEPEVQQVLGIDVVEMGRGFMRDEQDWKDWLLPDGTPCKIPGYINIAKEGDDWFLYTDSGEPMAVQKQGSLYFEQVLVPMFERSIEDDDFDDLPEMCARTMWAGVPHPGAHFALDAEGLRKLERGARNLRESTDQAIVALFGGNLFELPQWLYRMDNYLVYTALYPDAVKRLSEALFKMYLENLNKWLPAIAPYVDIVQFGDDLGSQNAPLISPQMYRDYYKPYHEKLWGRAKELADVKVMLHSCGAIEPLLHDLIEAGLDAVNPVQITCPGMDAAHLKRLYGERLCFWGGGCDTRAILPLAPPDRVRDHVREQVKSMGRGGGFVFQQVHNIMADVPVANIVAMFEAAHSVKFA